MTKPRHALRYGSYLEALTSSSRYGRVRHLLAFIRFRCYSWLELCLHTASGRWSPSNNIFTLIINRAGGQSETKALRKERDSVFFGVHCPDIDLMTLTIKTPLRQQHKLVSLLHNAKKTKKKTTKCIFKPKILHTWLCIHTWTHSHAQFYPLAQSVLPYLKTQRYLVILWLE